MNTSHPAKHIGAILVGGGSTRFGGPKALAKVGNRTIFERVLAAHREALPETVVVAAAGTRKAGPPGDDGARKVSSWAGVLEGMNQAPTTLLSDIVSGAGPLGGLHAALVWASDRDANGVCVTACDAPFLEPTLLRALVAASPGYDAVVPITKDPERLQPLFAWYSSEIVTAAEMAMRERKGALRHLIRMLPKVQHLPVDGIPFLRPPDLVFLNVNTPTDLDTARRALEEYPDES